MEVKITLDQDDIEEVIRKWAALRFPKHTAEIVPTYARTYEVTLTEKEEQLHGIPETFNPAETTLIHSPAPESSTQDDDIPF